MTLQRDRSANARRPRKGSALLMAFLMIILLYAIVFQLSYGTKADLRVTENDVTITQMDMAIESALQEVYDSLAQDAAASEGGGEAAGGMAPPTGGGAPGAGGDGQQGQNQPADSRMDSWGRPQRSTIGDIELRILVQDEDGKLNVLQLLFEDEEESEKALERVARLIDFFRDGSTVDVDRSEAIRIAQVMREHLRNRLNSVLPRAKQMSDLEDNRERALPMTLKEFEVLERLDPSLFRDFRDERGEIVHSLGSYLSVWTSVQQGSSQEDAAGAGALDAQKDPNGAGAGGQGSGQDNDPNWGVCVNVNTAPVAVLKALVDDRTVAPRFWDSVVEYRNLEKQDEEGAEGETQEEEPQLDEYGEEVVEREIFDTMEEVEDVDGWERLDDSAKDDVRSLLCVRSHVFSIYITARRKTGTSDDFGGTLGVPRPGEREDERGKGLVRTVRSVVWRKTDGETTQIVPLVRWEVLDYTPFEVIDFPVEGR
ncbi:MAG: general secretion pathway protein GspK [Planctomycetes bacterium]|nr:general secretion pathway protein GspK [Planctomycetota bacterium]